MTVQQLEAFVEVARAGSLTGAAERLGYSQSGLSRQMAALESTVGVGLVTRLPRGVELTAAGRALLPHARLVVSESRRGIASARRAVEGHSSLTLGAVPSASAALVPRALRLLQERSSPTYGEVNLISSSTGELVDMVAGGDLDAAVVTDAPPGLPAHHGLELHHLLDDAMVVLVPTGHPRAEAETVDFLDVAEETWVEDNDGSAALLDRLATRAGVEVVLRRGADSLVTKASLVAEGHGVALVPQLFTAALRRDLVAVELRDPVTRAVYLATRGDDPVAVAATEALLDAARELGLPSR